MALGRGGVSLVVMLAVMASSCQTEDKRPLPHYTSNGRGVAPTNAAENKSNRYFIEFRSRYALTYGHTYVVFGRADKNGNMINPEVAGLAPASDNAAPYVLGHFIPVPASTGATDGDLEEQYRSASWRVMLTDDEYSDTVAYIRKLQATSHLWEATVYNCNAFVADIARHMGYKAPGIWLRPQQFIATLREMNTG
ncbi:hypothetical protein [Rhizobium leguminosarum]|uniref:Lipoprotein n=1 Tax=Rhizobium leguminosarum TaxID=384 RepID=A0A1B1CIF3_RHILE|nr:hypothetical protein [Rhizobium leguminosarum]ANP89542.1 hypothetical protein BA011_27725 [Rhizobium leguminosarum]ASR10501.1 hypothetical protein CHY08_26030 [Rhizobium leguminosarum bv. viciae]RXT17910.1 hypothetical protein B5P46_29165 [Rhizobium leguminosarum]